MQLGGLHHVTAVTARVQENLRFYTRTLGMRLVKKTVNQDDVTAYHLFYADGVGSPGSDLTFFDWPAARERRGTRSVSRIGLRVSGEAALQWWLARLTAEGVRHDGVRMRDGRRELAFEDPEGQRLALVEDETRPEGQPWAQSPVPIEHQIRGLGPVLITVPEFAPLDELLTGILGMTEVRQYLLLEEPGGGERPVYVYEMDAEGPGAELHVAIDAQSPPARSGAGGVHHVAFRTTAENYAAWENRLREAGVSSSGPVDRFYFRSLYFREPNGLLFEIATDEPGFTADEPVEQLGSTLSLPPPLQPRRAEIEAQLKPLAPI